MFHLEKVRAIILLYRVVHLQDWNSRHVYDLECLIRKHSQLFSSLFFHSFSFYCYNIMGLSPNMSGFRQTFHVQQKRNPLLDIFKGTFKISVPDILLNFLFPDILSGENLPLTWTFEILARHVRRVRQSSCMYSALTIFDLET